MGPWEQEKARSGVVYETDAHEMQGYVDWRESLSPGDPDLYLLREWCVSLREMGALPPRAEAPAQRSADKARFMAELSRLIAEGA